MTLRLYSSADIECSEAKQTSGEASQVEPVTRIEGLEYLTEMVGELKDLACRGGHHKLGWALSLAHRQALDERDVLRQISQKARS